MNTDKLKEIMYFHNPWWVEKDVPDVLLPDYKRPILKTLLSYLEIDRILVIKGPRRTGKTTLLYQMASHLIASGVRPEDIFYLSFDDMEARGDFDEIVKTFQQVTGRVLGKGKKVYFFLDEIQLLENWSGYLKRYFDKKYPIKFIVSGSSASLIRKGAESLAGRTVEEVILPFSFYEYLDYHVRDEQLTEKIGRLQRDFDFHDTPLRDSMIPYETQIKTVFEEYLNKGGFPHLLNIKDRILWQKLMREDVVEKAIYRDLIELYQIKKPSVLEKLFLYLSEHSSELLNISNIANSLGLSREYTEIYIGYLKEAYLIFKYKRYSRSMETQIRVMEKCYVSDCGLIRLSMSFDPGKVVETIIASHLMDREAYYWRDQIYEVDIVTNMDGNVIPVEVKYKEEIKPADIRGVLRFLEAYGQKCGMVVTKNFLGKKEIDDRLILYIPAWLFLLISPGRANQ